MSSSFALCPYARLQFSDANGVPLAGGFVYSYALATYADGLGAAANPNPTVLDAAGSASIWLSAAAYKIVLEDLNGVVQWTQDNVSAVSLGALQGNTTFASITVTGAATIGGNETVDGTLTAATVAATGSVTAGGALVGQALTISGNGAVSGTFSPATLDVTGAETVGGALTVTGQTALANLSVNGTDIAALITSLIPAVTAVAGTLIVTNVATAGNWVIFTFGSTTLTKIQIALGAGGSIATGGTIPLPAGFTASQLIAHASVGSVSATAGNQLSQFAVSVTAGVITITASDNESHVFAPTANWVGFAWATGVV
jgi:hypothetical protein